MEIVEEGERVNQKIVLDRYFLMEVGNEMIDN
jgi:hypothetical protein